MGLVGYLFLAVVSLAIVQRVFQPISLRACAALVLMPLLFTIRAFVTGGIYAPIDLAYQTEPLVSYLDQAGVHDFHNSTLSDTYAQMIPWRAAVREAILSGDWPLINPYMLGGDLLAGSAQPAPYDFFNLAGLLVPFVDSITMTESLAFLWAAIGAFLLARRFGMSELSALFAATAWMGSSFVAFFSEAALGHTMLLLPLLCCAAIDVVRRPAIRSVIVLAVVLTWAIFAGHPESLLQVTLIACAFGIYELWLRPEHRRRAIAAALAGGVLAIFLSAIFLLPVIDALPQTTEYASRTSDGSEDLQTVSWKGSLLRLPANFIPFVYGSPWKEMSNAPPLISPHTATISGGFLGLAVAGALLSRRRRFLIGIAVFGLLAGIGFPPLVYAFSHVPLLALARNERFIGGTVLALALLVAMAVESKDTVRAGRTVLIVATALLLLSIAMMPLMREVRLSEPFIRTSMAALLIPMFLAAAVLLGVRRAEIAIPAVLLILLVQRTAGVGPMYPTLPRSAFYPEPAVLKQLNGHELYRFAAESSALLPNIGTHYGLEDVRGFQAMSLKKLEETFPLWCVGQRNWFNRIDSLESPFLSFLNVRYALHDPNRPLPPQWRTIGTAGRLCIVENTAVLPRAFIPTTLHHAAGSDIEAMKQARDFSAASWIDRGAATEQNGCGNVTMNRTTFSSYALRANLASDAWIVISQPAWKGWRAFDGGHEIPVRTANHAFLAIRLGRGEHEVALRFRPHSFVIGRAISISTLLGMVLLLLWPFRF
jgi:MYXO-CTERM domain-containing protein